MSAYFTLHGALRGAQMMAPLAISIFAYGVVYGMLARQAGLAFGEAVGMSALVAAGSAQFVVLGLWQMPLPAFSLVLTTLIINLRHLLMGIALHPWLAELSWRQRVAALFYLNDEAWALSMHELETGEMDVGFLFGANLTAIAAWVAATATGHVFSAWLPDPAQLGLDFAFTATFIALVIGWWRGRRSLLPWLTTAGVALMVAQTIGGTWHILLGGLLGSLIGAWHDRE